jgi:UDP-glucose 4-epimerase
MASLQEAIGKFNGLSIAITGGAGFIGSHLTERLLDAGAKVAVIDTFLRGSKIEHLRDRKALTVHDADVRDAAAMNRIIRGTDIVYHLAAVVGVEETQLAPYEVLDVEIRGTENVLNAAVKGGTKKIVFGSSSEVYGDIKEAMQEDARMAPKSTYAVTKLVGEEYCKAFKHKFGLDYTTLRYFNVYGPRQDERFVISRFIRKAKANETISIYGTGKQTRDFTHVNDAVNLTMLASILDEGNCQVLNLGTGKSTSINEMAALILKTLDKKNLKPVFVAYDKTRPVEIEIFNRTADVSRATKLLQYKAEIKLEDGIKELCNLM